MQRIFNIQKWTLVPDGKALSYEGDRPRRVNLEVNATGVANLFVVQKGENVFLARVEGRDTVEFYVDGTFAIAADGADVYVYTIDGETFEWTDVDPTSFAVVREKRERNYELEVIAARMAENMNRRLEAQAREIEASMERRARAREVQLAAKPVAPAVPPADSAAADDGGAGEEPAEAGKRGRGRPPRPPAGGSSE